MTPIVKLAPFRPKAPSPPSTSLPSASVPAAVIGPYKLLQQIGEGGMGTVYMAEQTQPVQRKVALKLIKPGMDSRQVIARFEAERQALALMDHPNIAKVLDAGTTSGESGCVSAGRPYFVMELVKGVPITKYCDAHHLTPRQRLELFVPVCQAVQHAHQKGIIHRDIKPSNVMVCLYDGKPVPKVIDFGVAKATGHKLTEKTLFTEVGSVVGTLEYMSPEQAELNQLDIDTRSDIYSLGVLLYELLTGTTPLERKRFKAAAFLEVLRLIREEESPKPSTRLSTTEGLPTIAANRGLEPKKLSGLVRGELDWIVMKALEKDRNRRYETANGFAADVQRYLADEAVSAGPPSVGYRVRKFVKRNRVAVLTGAVISVSIATGTAVAGWQAVVATRAKSSALTALGEKERALTKESEQRERAEQQTKLAETARLKAIASEADTRAFSEFLVEDVLSVARPKGDRGGLGINVTVKAALDVAEANIERRFQNRPRAEAIARHDLGVTYRLIGELDKSEEQFLRAYQLRAKTLGSDDEETLNTANSLAVLYNARGKYAEAEPMFLQVLDGFRRILGDEHEFTLVCMANLGTQYLHQHQYAKAEPLLVKAVEISRRVLGEEDSDTLSSMNNLANLYRKTGRLAEAEKLMLAAYNTSLRVQGEEQPLTLTIMGSVGSLYLSQGKTDLAEPLLFKALEMRRRVLGEGHPETFQSMSQVAMLHQRQGRFAEAETLYLKALEGRRRVLGDSHPELVDSMNELAGLYHSLGEFAKAEPLLLQALEVSRRAYGENGPITVDLLNNLAGLYIAQGNLDKAEPILIKALDGLRRVRGENHVHTIVSMGNLGALYRRKQDYTRAEAQLLATLEISRRVLGEDNSDTLSFVNELKMVYDDQNQFSKAEPLCREMLDKTRKHSGETSQETAGDMAALGLNLIKQKKFTDAEPILRECLKIRERHAADDWRTFSTKSVLGGSLLGQGKYADAEPLLLSGYEGLKSREAQIPPSGKSRLAEAVDRLVQFYDSRGQPEKAAEWRKKLPTSGDKKD